MLEAALVGTGGMMPLPNRFLSSMICRINGRMYLFDCGEGTQVSLKLLGWGFKQIDALCFTHFHADHISGLPGLLLTIGNAGRTEPLRCFGPQGLEAVVKSLCIIAPELPFPIQFTTWEPRKENTEILTPDIMLNALPVHHRTPCYAYSLQLCRRGKFDLARAQAAEVPMAIWSTLQKQNEKELVYNGRSFSSDMVLGPPRRGIKLAYCTDTRPVSALVPFASEADLFICEGLYGEDDEKAAQHMHMSFGEAAAIAREAKVKELWLTHFSPAMPEPRPFLSAATRIFPNTVVGRDRMTKLLRFDEDEDLK